MAKIWAILPLVLAMAAPATAGDLGATSSATVHISVSVAPRYGLSSDLGLCLDTNAEAVPASVADRPLPACTEKATAAPTMVETAGERLLIVRAE